MTHTPPTGEVCVKPLFDIADAVRAGVQRQTVAAGGVGHGADFAGIEAARCCWHPHKPASRTGPFQAGILHAVAVGVAEDRAADGRGVRVPEIKPGKVLPRIQRWPAKTPAQGTGRAIPGRRDLAKHVAARIEVAEAVSPGGALVSTLCSPASSLPLLLASI